MVNSPEKQIAGVTTLRDASHAVQDYLKVIYKLQQQVRPVPTAAIAERLDLSAPAVSKILKHLAALKLVNHSRYYGVELAEVGEKIALEVIRHHRLIELYLVKAHLVDELFGIVNVPSGVWIDEAGLIVRPPETAYPRRPSFVDREIPADATPDEITRITTVRQLRVEADTYIAALRDWIANGADSRFALAPDEVLRRSRPRPLAEATAAAHFELGQHLHRLGRSDDAIAHFREAYRLQPDNWTYKRQAWSLLGPGQSPMELYGSDWLTDVQKIGPENYYPQLDM